MVAFFSSPELYTDLSTLSHQIPARLDLLLFCRQVWALRRAYFCLDHLGTFRVMATNLLSFRFSIYRLKTFYQCERSPVKMSNNSPLSCIHLCLKFTSTSKQTLVYKPFSTLLFLLSELFIRGRHPVSLCSRAVL